MDRKQAEKAEFVCQKCGADATAEIEDAPGSPLGFSIASVVCPVCHTDLRGDEASTEELLGV